MGTRFPGGRHSSHPHPLSYPSGTIPTEIGGLTELVNSANNGWGFLRQLGSIPVRNLDQGRSSKIHGPIPTELGQLSKYVGSFDLSMNGAVRCGLVW